MTADGADIFDYVLTEQSVKSSAGIELYIDEIALSAGLDTFRFIDLPKRQRVQIAARWMAKRQLDLVVQDMMRVRAKPTGSK